MVTARTNTAPSDHRSTTDQDRRRIRPETLEKLRQVVIRQFASRLYVDVGIREIIREAGVSPKTVYKYFGSKDQLLLACVEADLRQLRSDVTAALASVPELGQKLDRFVQVVADFYVKNTEVARIVFLMIPVGRWMQEPAFLQAHIRQPFEKMLVAAAEDGQIPAEDVTVLTDLLLGGAQRVLTSWLLTGQQDLPATVRVVQSTWRRAVGLPQLVGGDQSRQS